LRQRVGRGRFFLRQKPPIPGYRRHADDASRRHHFTGTPEGVISGYAKDKQVWLDPDDKLVTLIEKLGDLSFALT
jgi:hypothetical protein